MTTPTPRTDATDYFDMIVHARQLERDLAAAQAQSIRDSMTIEHSRVDAYNLRLELAAAQEEITSLTANLSARNAEILEAQEARERAEALAESYRAELHDSAMAELPRLMSEISEKCYCAGWMHGTEYRLWIAIADEHDDGAWGRDEIDENEKARLARLSEIVGGWFVWDDDAGDDNPQFIVMDEWKRRLALRGQP